MDGLGRAVGRGEEEEGDEKEGNNWCLFSCLGADEGSGPSMFLFRPLRVLMLVKSVCV